MQGKVSIFSSGKMISLGTKSEEAARRDLLHAAQLLGIPGIRTDTMKIEVQNVVVTVDLEQTINLETLQDVVPGIIYEPEQFPGAVFKPQSSDAAALLFASGKMVVAGLKSTSTVEKTVKGILDELEDFNSS